MTDPEEPKTPPQRPMSVDGEDKSTMPPHFDRCVSADPAASRPRDVRFDMRPRGNSEAVAMAPSLHSSASAGSLQSPTTPSAQPLGKGIKAKDKRPTQGFAFKPKPTTPSVPLDKLADETLVGKLDIEGRIVPFVEQDFDDQGQLGRGAFGCVKKLHHRQLHRAFAVKQIRDSMDPNERQRLLTDLQVIRKAKCRYIVSYYGFNVSEGELWIFMEEMMVSLDKMYLRVKSSEKRFPEDVLGVIACSVLFGLHYLMSKHDVMHRDVKPSNILCGFHGEIKLCDFGISKVMDASLVKTNVGCERYLPPERVNPESAQLGYDVRSDVWAYGLTLVELALLRYPYPDENMFERLKAIVNGEPPRIPAGEYSPRFTDLTAICLQKTKTMRPRYDSPPEDDRQQCALLDHPFIVDHADSTVDVATWYRSL